MPMPASLESIDPSARLLFAACGLALATLIVSLIRRHALKEKYALLWLPLGGGFLVTSLFPELLLELARMTRLHYLTVVLLGVILVFGSILLYFTVRLSSLREDVKSLGQEIALLKAEASADRVSDRRSVYGPGNSPTGDAKTPHPLESKSGGDASGWTAAPPR